MSAIVSAINLGHWRTRALIDLDALRHNVDYVHRKAPNAKVMAVVKSNAYGHGALEIAGAITERVDAFAVATIDEGIELRAAGINQTIVVLSAFWNAEQVSVLNTFKLTPVIHHLEQINWLEKEAKRPQSTWIKINTGMNRLGLQPDELVFAVSRVEAIPAIKIVGLMSHLANADDVEDPMTTGQSKVFQEACCGFNYPRSLANSAAILSRSDMHFDWVRPGIMLYGGSPLLEQSAQSLNLQPVMRLESRLISLRMLESGSAVGYGALWRSHKTIRLGIAAIGYGDGYPIVIDPETCAMVGEQRCRIVGRVSMDSLALDLSECKDTKVGDVVTLWGGRMSVDEVAGHAGTIGYELLCRITSRVPRLVVH